ncbi:DUF6763 family protein [Desulfosediminicola flagellatus]|uniref:DUF6763 family protein n=1 Tax=Desulfosediminicola flagellatus TaxID=2569541 RepID=UPI0010AD4055|nr:DUF6763 family protein [Desulfosediminicola flagellatus]
MDTKADPIIDNWYCHLDKGQRFFVVAIDEDTQTIEVQHFDGNIEEFDLATWYKLDIDRCEPPENWSGALDIDDVDDFGTEITDTKPADWDAPFNEFETWKDKPPEE